MILKWICDLGGNSAWRCSSKYDSSQCFGCLCLTESLWGLYKSTNYMII